MDARAFLEVNLLSVDDFQLAELKKFSRSSFELGPILANASDLKYTREIKRILMQELNQPSEDCQGGRRGRRTRVRASLGRVAS